MGVFTREQEPDEQRQQPKSYGTVRAMAASGAVVKATDKTEVEALKQRRASQKWQDEAYEYVEHIGELDYAFTLYSNVLSRIRIFGAYVLDDQDTPTPIKTSEASDELKKDVSEAMQAVFGGGKMASILRDTAYNLLVAGECYLINRTTNTSGRSKEVWEIVSIDQLVPLAEKGFGLRPRRDIRDQAIKPLPRGTFIGRIWRSNPRYTDEPKSSMMAICDLCNELLLLSRSVRATARSRLNAGALLIPDEIGQTRDITTDEVEDDIDAYVEEEHDEFEEELIDHMMTPVSDEGSAAAVVPIIFRGPGESLEKVRLLKFERSFDAALAVQRDRDLDRILQGIELPKEIVSGLANIKYSNAIQINESLYTSHIEPMVIMLCDIFRTIYLEPYLFRLGHSQEEIDKVVIWYDPSGITTAPDKSTAANVGFDKRVLSAKAWRSANGFNEEDAPSDREKAIRIAFERGPVTPEYMDTVLNELVPDLFQAIRAQTMSESGAPLPGAVNDMIGGNAQAPPADPGAPAEGGEAAPEGLIDPGEGAPAEEGVEGTPPPAAAPESGDFTDGFTTDDEA